MICNDHREDEDMDGTRTATAVPIDPERLARELEALRTRARHLAAVQGLDVEHRTLALAGRIVLGLAPEVRA